MYIGSSLHFGTSKLNKLFSAMHDGKSESQSSGVFTLKTHIYSKFCCEDFHNYTRYLSVNKQIFVTTRCLIGRSHKSNYLI